MLKLSCFQRISFTTILVITMGIPFVMAQSDSAPLGSIVIWPILPDASSLGRGATTIAWSDTPASGLGNPASLLSIPMGALEISYTGLWGDHPLKATFNPSFSDGLSFIGIKLASTGLGLALYRSTPVNYTFEWNVPSTINLDGIRFPSENARLDTQWRSLGVDIALRVAYDFVIGAGIRKDTLKLDGLAIQSGLEEGQSWTIRYQGDKGDWTYKVGALWELNADVQIGIAYHWNPVVLFPAQVQFMLNGEPTDSPVETPVRFGYPDNLSLGSHFRQGRYHLSIDAIRWKTGRINKDPWLQLFIPQDQRLRFKNQWDFRFGLSVETMLKTMPLLFQVGFWNKPQLRPAWEGDPETEQAAYFSARWPKPKNHWHWTAGFQFRPQRNIQFSIAGVTGSELKSIILSLSTIY